LPANLVASARTARTGGRSVTYGLFGGFLGAVAMGLLALMMPVPNTGGAPFFVAAAMQMGVGAMATAAGWMLHLVTGIVVGGIFGVVVAKVASLRARGLARGLGLGALTGFVVWVVFFLPMMAMLMPALMSMATMVAGSFAAHIVYGLVLGATVGGLGFKTQSELMDHSKKAHAMPAQQSASPTGQIQMYRCGACGMAFSSQGELTEHSHRAHPM